MAKHEGAQRLSVYCGLCVARCGATAVVEDGRFSALENDPAHPTGQALCAKGRAAPELVYHPERLSHPLRRTRPKGDPDPGWERISWDEALNLTAGAMREIAERHGPESVAFSLSSPSSRSAVTDPSLWQAGLCQTFLNALKITGLLVGKNDPPPLKWSDLRYVFDSQEGHDGKEALQG